MPEAFLYTLRCNPLRIYYVRMFRSRSLNDETHEDPETRRIV